MNIEFILFYACLVCLIVSLVLTTVFLVRKKSVRKGTNMSQAADSSWKGFSTIEKAVLFIAFAGFLFITAWIILRAIETGHGPFSSMYEFAVAFVWGILLMGNFFTLKYHNLIIHSIGMLTGSCLLVFAGTLSTKASSLVPALQNSTLLSVHVASAVVAYGAFTIGFIASILLIIQRNDRFTLLPDSKSLEQISYHAVIIGFPFMTLVIVLGALWADIAWGRYWGWDPKETASLVTWLIYAGYLHTRIMRGWQGKKSALLLIIGFCAVIFTFFGNFIFIGLHSY